MKANALKFPTFIHQQKRFRIELHSMPVLRTFKLNVRFNISDNKQNPKNIISKPGNEKVLLNEDEKYSVTKLGSIVIEILIGNRFVGFDN